MATPEVFMRLWLSKKVFETLLFRLRIAEVSAPRHLHLFIALVVILLFHQSLTAQIFLTDIDIAETIKFYKTENPAAFVKNFQTRMPAPIKDEKLRNEILRKLPAAVLKSKIENEKIVRKFREVAEPILELYGRDKIYDVIIFSSKTPIMLSDTGVVLVISSGLIERAESDDEIMGYIAHEIGHEYYASYSIYTKHLLKLTADGGREPFLTRKYAEALSLIELQCDGFAAFSLTHLGYNLFAFIEGFERTERDFPNHRVGFHPPDSVRRKLVTAITPTKVNAIPEAKISTQLKELKKLLN